MKKIQRNLLILFLLVLSSASFFIEESVAAVGRLNCPADWGEVGKGDFYCGIPTYAPFWQVSEDICSIDFLNNLESRVGDNCEVKNWGKNTVYCIPGVAQHGRYNWKGVRTGIGWTGYWKSLIGYCKSRGIWESVTESPLIRYGKTSSISFTIKEEAPGYHGQLKEQTDKRVTIEGIKKEPSQIVHTPTFNSPNIYLKNMPTGNIDIKINSEWNEYINQSPSFNQERGWMIDSKNKTLLVGNENIDHLYYELGLKKVALTRKGQNFETKEALVNFLKTSDFFQDMGMSEIEKQNALAYVLPQIPTSPNYYLTILNNPEQITQLEITPAAKVIQRYFVIYPTTIPVTTTGGLAYPKSIEGKDEFIVKNYGEIIIKPNMFVVWE